MVGFSSWVKWFVQPCPVCEWAQIPGRDLISQLKERKKSVLTENHHPLCIICFVKSSKSYCHQLETEQTRLMQSMLGMRKCFCFLKQALGRSACLACHSISGFKCFSFCSCNIFAYAIIKTFLFLLALYLFGWFFLKSPLP